MEALIKLIDASLFLYFLIIALAVPLIDGQTFLPLDLYPKFLVELKSWFFKEIDNYLPFEMPHCYVGIAWFQLLFQWPVALVCVCAIAAGKSWFNTSLIYGSSILTTLAAILTKLIGSKRASDKLLKFYYTFVGFGVLSFTRCLLPYAGKSAETGQKPVLNRKKIA